MTQANRHEDDGMRHAGLLPDDAEREEARRHACEVRMLVNMPTDSRRRLYLEGVRQHRGAEATDRLRQDVWNAMKAQTTTPSLSCGQPAPQPVTAVRDTSMAAYRALKFSGKLGRQEQLVVDHFVAHPGRQFTRQELARDLRLGINAVCGRVKDLLDEPLNVLVENGKKRCEVTGNDVNALELSRQP